VGNIWKSQQNITKECSVLQNVGQSYKWKHQIMRGYTESTILTSKEDDCFFILHHLKNGSELTI
jgi:hypothetical protein